jgi:hypothetical protein
MTDNCFQSFQKIVVQKVTRTFLKVCVGEFPTDMISVPEHFIYFLRASEGMVPLPNSATEAAQLMPVHFEISVISGHSLDMLEMMLNMVCQLTFYRFICVYERARR